MRPHRNTVIAEAYLRHMTDTPVPDLPPYSMERLARALARAEAVRDFEISLYWNRTTYFWGFQVALMAMAGLLLGPALGGGLSEELVARLSPENEKLTLALVLSAICLLGLLVSAIWVQMLAGAKFWQDNWERHVDLLEDALQGPLYKTYFVSSKSPGKPTSVTKANALIATAFAVFWASLALIPLWQVWAACDWLVPRDKLTVTGSLFLYLFVLAAARQGLQKRIEMSDFASQHTHVADVTHQLWIREALISPKAVSSEDHTSR